MFHAKKDQITGDNNQNYCNSCQIRIYLHDLFPPFVDKIENKQNQTTDNNSKKVCINSVPFDHDSASLAKSNENLKNQPAMNNDAPKLSKSSITLCGRTIKGEITPAENQATAILPDISEALSSWPAENFPIDDMLTQGSKKCQ